MSTKIHSLLIAIDRLPADAGPEVIDAYNVATKSVRQILEKVPEIEMLSQNVLLMSLKNSFEFPRKVFSHLEEYKIKYRLLFFEEAPNWVYSHPPDKKA